jgi:hypothetical protein
MERLLALRQLVEVRAGVAVASARDGRRRRRSTNSEREETFRPPTGRRIAEPTGSSPDHQGRSTPFGACSSIGIVALATQASCHTGPATGTPSEDQAMKL